MSIRVPVAVAPGFVLTVEPKRFSGVPGSFLEQDYDYWEFTLSDGTGRSATTTAVFETVQQGGTPVLRATLLSLIGELTAQYADQGASEMVNAMDTALKMSRISDRFGTGAAL